MAIKSNIAFPATLITLGATGYETIFAPPTPYARGVVTAAVLSNPTVSTITVTIYEVDSGYTPPPSINDRITTVVVPASGTANIDDIIGRGIVSADRQLVAEGDVAGIYSYITYTGYTGAS